MEALADASFTSPLANANIKIQSAPTDAGLLAGLCQGFNAWTLALTLLVAALAYDQCTQKSISKPMQRGVAEASDSA